MVKPSHILGINARNQLYTSLNSKESKKFGFSKIRAKSFLSKHGIGVPKLYAKIATPEQMHDFDWNTVQGAFALKPANGSEGKGIIVIKRHDKKKGIYIDVANEKWTKKDLQLHIGDTLQGAYTTWGNNNIALIEERIPVHPDLEEFVEIGTPDVRVIVFNKIPVMAECRLPTWASQGKANIHQGAIALGVDMGTGETTYGLSGLNKAINAFPATGRTVRGIKIPYWNDLLKTAVRCANATGFVYVGVDMFMHPERGPLVAELNGFPGNGIQIANHAGLKRRLQRVEEIEARNVNHAVRIGQALFAESYALPAGDLTIIEPKQDVLIYDHEENKHTVNALINTGRFRSAISKNLAEELGLTAQSDFLWNQDVEGEGKVPVIETKIKIKDRVLNASLLVTKSMNGKANQIEIGRSDLSGFLVGEAS